VPLFLGMVFSFITMLEVPSCEFSNSEGAGVGVGLRARMGVGFDAAFGVGLVAVEVEEGCSVSDGGVGSSGGGDGGGTHVGHGRGVVSGKDDDGEGGNIGGNKKGSLTAVRARSRANDSLRAARDASSAGDAQREGERLDESTIVIDRFEMVNLPRYTL
jgi:hypothetical protein